MPLHDVRGVLNSSDAVHAVHADGQPMCRSIITIMCMGSAITQHIRCEYVYIYIYMGSRLRMTLSLSGSGLHPKAPQRLHVSLQNTRGGDEEGQNPLPSTPLLHTPHPSPPTPPHPSLPPTPM